MSQTSTYGIELDTLPTLERGHPLERNIGIHRSKTDNSAVNERDSSSLVIETNPSITTQGGVRIGSIVIRDKVLYLLGACMGIFAVGLNDTATGANLPSIQGHYNLPYTVVSLVFLAGFVGYFVSCMASSPIQNAIGTRWVLMIAGVLYAAGSLLISFAPPFPAVMAGLALMGFGGGFYDACLTSVISHFENRKFMSTVYAFYGLGAVGVFGTPLGKMLQRVQLVGPFIIGALAKAGTSWNLYYWFPLSLSVFVTLCHFVFFKHYIIPAEEEGTEYHVARTRLAQIARMPLTWVTMILILLTFAISPTLGNWLTSYLIDVKGSGPDVSRYQLSIFWAGLTLGRIFFSLPFVPLPARSGNILLLLLVCAAIAILWTVNSDASDWIVIGVAGFLLGPNNPEILSILSSRVPSSLKGAVISVTIGLGLTGATIGPLVFGVVVGKIEPGLRILPPVVIVLAGVSTLTFWAIPGREKRD